MSKEVRLIFFFYLNDVIAAAANKVDSKVRATSTTPIHYYKEITDYRLVLFLSKKKF